MGLFVNEIKPQRYKKWKDSTVSNLIKLFIKQESCTSASSKQGSVITRANGIVTYS